MPHVILLSGAPGAGKTTFYFEHLYQFHRVSSDDIITRLCEAEGITYEQGFSKHVEQAQTDFTKSIEYLQRSYKKIVIDRTHVTEKSRKRILSLINPRYKKTCIYFPSYTPSILAARIKERTDNGGHSVPFEAIEQMHKDFTVPRYSEGFDFLCGSHEFVRIKELGLFNGL